MRRFFLISFISLFSLSAFAFKILARSVTSENPVFKLELKSNRSTGFSWFLAQYDRHLITPLGVKYIPPKSDRLGASGKVLWRMKVNPAAFSVPQTTKVTWAYARSFEYSPVEKTVLVLYISP